MHCPLCHKEGSPHIENQGFVFLCCSDCDHVYLDHQPGGDHTERVYDDEYFFGGGAGYDDYLAQKEVVMERGRFYERKLCAVMPPGRILDVGSGAGFTLQAFREAGWRVTGLEPNARMAAFAMREAGVPTRHGTMEEFVTDHPFDAIVALQVAAHFVDPIAALERCFSSLRPGGYLLVETWDSESLTARLLKSRWHEYSPPSVLHCFSKSSLDSFAGSCGFVPVKQRTTLKKIRAGHAKSLLREKAEHSFTMRMALQVASILPDRLTLVYPADDLFWSLYYRPDAAADRIPSAQKENLIPQPAACHV